MNTASLVIANNTVRLDDAPFVDYQACEREAQLSCANSSLCWHSGARSFFFNDGSFLEIVGSYAAAYTSKLANWSFSNGR